MADDPILLSLAATAADPAPSTIQRRYTNTFRHLRIDGILHLLDVDLDTYLLLWVYRVLVNVSRDFVAREEK